MVFTVVFLAQEALPRGELNPVAAPVSALEAGPNGWVQRLNFLVFGLLTMAHAIGLHRGMRSPEYVLGCRPRCMEALGGRHFVVEFGDEIRAYF